MRTLRSYLTLTFLASVLTLAACSDDSGSGNNNADTGGDTGGDTGDQGTPDTNPDSTPDSTPDVGDACANPNTMCFTPLPSSNPNPRVMIERINIADDYVVIKNVNTVNVTLDGWFVCQRPNYQPLPNGITLGPAQRLRINLGQTGTDTADEIFLPLSSALTREDEIAFFATDASVFESSDDIRVYLRWGSPASGLNRASQADAAGLWDSGTFVPVCGDNTGIIAVGDGTLPIGFRDVPGTCPQL